MERMRVIALVGGILGLCGLIMAVVRAFFPLPPKVVTEAPCEHAGRCFRRGGEWVSCRKRKAWRTGQRRNRQARVLHGPQAVA